MDDYFPENAYYLLDMNHKNPIEQVREIIKQPIDIEALTKARNIVLDEFNIWEVIRRELVGKNDK